MSQRLSHYENSDSKSLKINTNPRKYYESQKAKNADVTEEGIENKKEEDLIDNKNDPGKGLIKDIMDPNFGTSSQIYKDKGERLLLASQDKYGKTMDRFSPRNAYASGTNEIMTNPQFANTGSFKKSPIPPQKMAFRLF